MESCGLAQRISTVPVKRLSLQNAKDSFQKLLLRDFRVFFNPLTATVLLESLVGM
jgi:hypothetical protein